MMDGWMDVWMDEWIVTVTGLSDRERGGGLGIEDYNG